MKKPIEVINKSKIGKCKFCTGKNKSCKICNGTNKIKKSHYIIIDNVNKIAIDSDTLS